MRHTAVSPTNSSNNERLESVITDLKMGGGPLAFDYVDIGTLMTNLTPCFYHAS